MQGTATQNASARQDDGDDAACVTNMQWHIEIPIAFERVQGFCVLVAAVYLYIHYTIVYELVVYVIVCLCTLSVFVNWSRVCGLCIASMAIRIVCAW